LSTLSTLTSYGHCVPQSQADSGWHVDERHRQFEIPHGVRMVPSVRQLTICTLAGGLWLPLQLNRTASPKAEITNVYTGVYGEQALTSVSVAVPGSGARDTEMESRQNAALDLAQLINLRCAATRESAHRVC
jgi:hypothetical protein